MLRSQSTVLSLILLSLLLTLGTVYTQFSVYGTDYLEESQAKGHQAIIGKSAPSPFQYRVLSEWALEGILRAGRRGGIASPVPAFILLRGLQNFLIFILAALWYRRLTGGNTLRIALGLIFLAWGMSYAFREGGLEFPLYSSAIFCLLAALAISARRDFWIPAVTFFAALNQETAAAIPFAYLACRIQLPLSRKSLGARTLLLFILSLFLYLGVFLGLRFHFGWKPLGEVWLHRPGTDLLAFNYAHTLTWAKLVWTLNILPLAGLLAWRAWPSELKRWALALLPIAFLVVPSYQWLSETRAVLAPLAVVFAPGALLLEQAVRAARPRFSRFARTAIIVALTLTTVYAQSWLLWPRYLRESQLERHREVMENRAVNPWQYRVLSEVVTEAFLRLGGALGLASPAPAFLFFRILQNAAIFLLAAAYYRRLTAGSHLSAAIRRTEEENRPTGRDEPGRPCRPDLGSGARTPAAGSQNRPTQRDEPGRPCRPDLRLRASRYGGPVRSGATATISKGGRQSPADASVALGLIALAWGMSYATYNSDLHFSTYSEIIFYLLALLAVIKGRDWWIPPLTLLAALNRETAVFIPSFFLLSRVRFRGIKPVLDRRSAGIFLAAASLYAAAYFGLRWSLGWRSFIEAWGAPGLLRLRENLAKGIGWQYLFLTVNALPLLGMASFRGSSRTLACAFWGIALPWLFAHYAGKACLEETRFLLLPLAIVFIPGALLLGGVGRADGGEGDYNDE